MVEQKTCCYVAEKFEAVVTVVAVMAVVAEERVVVVPEAMAEAAVEFVVAGELLVVESEAVVEFSVAVVVGEEEVAVLEPALVVLLRHFSWQDQALLEDHPFLYRPSDQV